MIRNETEYQAAVAKIEEEGQRLEAHRRGLEQSGLTEEQVSRAMAPLETFHLQLRESIESYEKLRRGEFEELRNFEGLGRLLVGLRIARGLSQRELAERFGVHESQVSRDERNEYHGLSLQRAQKILQVLGVTLHSHVEAFSVRSTAAA